MDRLTTIINKFPSVTALCIGDLMLDHFVYGEVSRISPEAPVPILHVQHQHFALGGAGNVVQNIKALGGQVYPIGVIGEDFFGEEFKILLQSKALPLDGLVTCSHYQTIVKKRYCAGSHQLLRVDYECIENFSNDIYEKLLEAALRLLPTVNCVILSDYGKGVLHPDLIIKPLIQAARQHKIPIIVDPKGSDYRIYKDAMVVTPNRKELREATIQAGIIEKNCDNTIVKAGKWLLNHTGIENILITRSEEGITLIKQNLEPVHFKAKVREVTDVSGAGDTVVATLGMVLGCQESLEDGAHLANLAGTVVVGKVGTATVSAQELHDSILEEEYFHEQNKVLSLEDAKDMIRKWRQKGHKIGFTNGCFDLLHFGHLSLLKQSRAACDHLVVGLNSDQSVQRLKGESRPIQSEHTRSLILAALEYVDMVIIFEEDTPFTLIHGIMPDILVKGADYTVDRVIGSDLVIKNGGRVVLIELEQGHSTTKTIRKMNS